MTKKWIFVVPLAILAMLLFIDMDKPESIELFGREVMPRLQ